MLEQNKRKLAQIYAFLAFIVIAMPVVANNYVLNTFSDVFFYVVVCLGLNIVVGYAGLLDLGPTILGLAGPPNVLPQDSNIFPFMRMRLWGGIPGRSGTHVPFTLLPYDLVLNFLSLGRYDDLIKTLVDEEKQVGNYSLVWDGKADNGKQVSAGIYMAKIKQADKIKTNKLIIAK